MWLALFLGSLHILCKGPGATNGIQVPCWLVDHREVPLTLFIFPCILVSILLHS